MTFRRTFIPALAILLALAAAGTARADKLLTIKSHTDAVQFGGVKQDARDAEIRVWVGDQKVRRDDTNVSTILRLDTNKMYLVDHLRKVYNTFDLPIDIKKLYGKDGEEAFNQASEMAKLEVDVTPRDEKRKIEQWDTQRYDVVMSTAQGLKVETVMWVSKDVGVDWATLAKMVSTMTALKPGSMDWVKKMETVQGYPVLQESTATMLEVPFKSSERLLSVEAREAPTGLYEPPVGYTLKPFDPTHPMMAR